MSSQVYADLVVQVVPPRAPRPPSVYSDGDILEVFTIASKDEQIQDAQRRQVRRFGLGHRAFSYPSAHDPYPTHPNWHAKWLWLKVYELTPEDAGLLVSPLERANPDGTVSTIKTRAYTIDWRDLEGMTRSLIARIENPANKDDPRPDLPVYNALTIARRKV